MNFRTAAYIRLSREDGDKAESDSVMNQRRLLYEFIQRKEELELADTYIDDGWSGTNFKRPSFGQMIQDIEEGKIDCVIVKDLSRFGRDYLETGAYLERYFPKKNVRFISIIDGIDSEKKQYDLMMPIKNLLNEQYARDISKKVHAAMRTKQEAGQFIGAFASYGYQKSPKDKNQLVIDPYAAEIVRKIFDMYGEGYGKNSIARWLNEQKILCPSAYKRENGEHYQNGNQRKNTSCWTYSTIHKMLQNEIYAGNMVQGKKYQEVHKKQKVTKREDWVIVEKTQEAIIDPQTWERTQRLLQKKTRVTGKKEKKSLFAGFLKCKDCGRSMVKKGEGEKSRYYCGTYVRSGKEYCTAHIIPEALLKEVLGRDFKTIFPAVLEEWKRQKQEKIQNKTKKRETQKRRLQAEYEKVRYLKRELYEDFKAGILLKEEWMSYQETYRQKEKSLKQQLEAVTEEKESLDLEQESVFEKIWMKRAVLSEMIEEILITEGTIQIVYRFSPLITANESPLTVEEIQEQYMKEDRKKKMR